MVLGKLFGFLGSVLRLPIRLVGGAVQLVGGMSERGKWKAELRKYPDALLTAASNGDSKRVCRLLDLGHADIERRGRFNCSPLHAALDNVHRVVHGEVVEVLLQRGADVHARDSLGNTPLHKAVVFGAAVVVEALLERGADVNAVNKQITTALHKAVLGGDQEVMEVLLSRGADVNIRDKGVCTPLHKAVGVKNVAAVQKLLSRGALVNAPDSLGNTPLDKANYLEHDAIKKLLEAKGGQTLR